MLEAHGRAGHAPPRPRRHVRLRPGDPRRADRRLRRVHGHGAHGDPEEAARPRPGRGARRRCAPRTRRSASSGRSRSASTTASRSSIRGDDAKRLNIRTISDAVPHAAEWRAGFGYEFRQRQDGYPGLHATYGLLFKFVRLMDLGLLYRGAHGAAGRHRRRQRHRRADRRLRHGDPRGRQGLLPALRGRARRAEGGAREPAGDEASWSTSSGGASTRRRCRSSTSPSTAQHRNPADVMRKFREEAGL